LKTLCRCVDGYPKRSVARFAFALKKNDGTALARSLALERL
jgi:hypothetical protein